MAMDGRYDKLVLLFVPIIRLNGAAHEVKSGGEIYARTHRRRGR